MVKLCDFVGVLTIVLGGVFIGNVTKNVLAAGNDVDVSVSLSSVLNITVSQPDTLVIDATKFETLQAVDIQVDVGTNNIVGYNMVMSSTTTNLSGSTGVIPTLESRLSANDFTLNHWGISYDGGVNYEPFTTTYNFEPTEGPANHSYTNLKAGVKVDTAVAAGTYANTINFVAVANVIPVYEKEIVGLGTIEYESGMTWGKWIESEYNIFGLGKMKFETVAGGFINVFHYGPSESLPAYHYKEIAFSQPETYFITLPMDFGEYEGRCLWVMYGLGNAGEMAMYREVHLDDIIDLMYEHYDDDGQSPAVYEYMDYSRYSTISLHVAGNNQVLYGEFDIEEVMTWGEFIRESTMLQFVNGETGEWYGDYVIGVINDVITFTNVDDLNEVYVLPDVSPNDIILGKEYMLEEGESAPDISGVFMIGEMMYNSFRQALTAVQDGGTIYIVGEMTFPPSTPVYQIDKSITIEDGQGTNLSQAEFIINGSVNFRTSLQDDIITVNDNGQVTFSYNSNDEIILSINDGGTAIFNNAPMSNVTIENNGELVFAGCTLSNVMVNNYSNLTLNNNLFLDADGNILSPIDVVMGTWHLDPESTVTLDGILFWPTVD